MAKKNINRYIVTNPDGKEYKVDDLNKFCKEHDLWPSNMRKVAQGKAKTSKGWTCGYDDKEPEGKERGDEEMQTLTFNVYGARDINVYHEDFMIEDLKDRNLLELYEEIMESFEDQRESFIYHEEKLDDIMVEEDDVGECGFTINRNKFKLNNNQVRVICYYYYDDTEYSYCEMELPEGKDIKITVNTEEICKGLEYVNSIILTDGFNEESEDDEIYFELDSASPGDEEAAIPKIVICSSKGIIDNFIIADESNLEKRFEKAIKSIL